MNKKKLLLIIGTVLLILLIILLRPRHIKLSLSNSEDLSVVREGNEITLTSDEKSKLIDMIEDITVMPWLYPQSTGWTYRIFIDNRTNRSNHKTAVFDGNKLKSLTDALAFTPSHPVTFYDDTDSSIQYVLNIQYKSHWLSQWLLLYVDCPL